LVGEILLVCSYKLSRMETYYDLIIRCPACIAEGKHGGNPTQWYHTNCGGKIQVGDDANFKCASCSYSSHIKNWRYACQAHATDFRATTSNHLASAVSTAGQVVGIAGKKWLINLLENLGEDW
jgi:hypothetical protein